MLVLARKPFHRLSWGLALGLVGAMAIEGWLRHHDGAAVLGNVLVAGRAAAGMLAVWVIVLQLHAQRRLQTLLSGGPRRRFRPRLSRRRDLDPDPSALRVSERRFHVMTWCLVAGTLLLPVLDAALHRRGLAQATVDLIQACGMCAGMVVSWGLVLALDRRQVP
jgi:hypothetical protein